VQIVTPATVLCWHAGCDVQETSFRAKVAQLCSADHDNMPKWLPAQGTAAIRSIESHCATSQERSVRPR
jgi:hypothetical protein